MRIVAGRFKGRTLRGPTGPGVRPTSDGLRETLFNVLRDRAEGARFLDGYAGTGAVGLEAVSRGARGATFVERDRAALKVLDENITACGAGDVCTVVRDSFIGVGGRHAALGTFDLVFLDPPYEAQNLEAAVQEADGLIGESGLIVLEHSRRRESPASVSGLVRERVLTSGDSALSFYARNPSR